MKISYYCTRRGREQIPWNDFLARARQEGYNGIETTLPDDPDERNKVLQSLARHGLQLKALLSTSKTPGFIQHARQLENTLQALLDANPFLISLQTGKDHFSFDQNTQLLLMSKRVAHERSVTILQETQRGKFAFAVHVTAQYLRAMPSLLLDLDLSQWYTVAGNYLEDQDEAVDLALSRTAHIRARVGETDDLQQYLQKWDRIVERHRGLQSSELGFTCDTAIKTILTDRYGN
jgi:sugar phosphate isomerase/epimerase